MLLGLEKKRLPLNPERKDLCGTLKRHEYRRIRNCWWCPRQKDLPRARIYGLSGVLVWHCRGHYQWPIVAQGRSPTTHPLRPAYLRP